MLIYKVGEADAGERWHPTQAQAQGCAKAYGGTVQQVTAAEAGRDGMCAMLNEAELTIHERHDTPVVEEAAPLAVEPKQEVIEKFARNRETNEIIDFILDEATPAQASRILEALGGRIGSWAQDRKAVQA